MKNSVLKNKKGITLVEILVATTVLLLVLGMVTSIITFSSRFFSDEDSQLIAQENMRILAVLLDKDIRSSDQTITQDNNCTTIGQSVEYCINGFDVSRNSSVVAKGIATFDIILSINSNFVDILIESLPDKRSKVIRFSSRVYLRHSVSTNGGE